MSLLLVLAGPNGSGKSSIVTEVINSPRFPQIYINPDELVKEYRYIPDPKTRYETAMNDAASYRQTAVDNDIDLAFETVFSTEEKLDFMIYAKQHGYCI